MKRVLLDENLPHPLRGLLSEFDVFTVFYRGWSGVKNGELLRLADSEFDVFVTGDKNLRYQQNLTQRKIAIVELPATRMDLIVPHISVLRDSILSSVESDYQVIR